MNEDEKFFLEKCLSIKVAVILPVYNAAKYLRECLDSLLGQKHRNFVVFAIDDGSKDNSLSILNDYAENYDLDIEEFDLSPLKYLQPEIIILMNFK